MDDILASIRKIISDDDARMQNGEQRPSDHPGQMTFPTGGLARSPSPADDDDVLLLTDLIEDGQPTAAKSPSDTAPSSTTNEPLAPQSSSSVDPVPAQFPPIKISERSDPAMAPASDGFQGRTASQPLVEPEAAGAALSALHRLNQAVEDSIPPVSAPDPGPVLGAGSSKTIEDMIAEMLRPMLKEWLDKNLPTMVGSIVEREISRLTRR
jgi:hypothetical protein